MLESYINSVHVYYYIGALKIGTETLMTHSLSVGLVIVLVGGQRSQQIQLYLVNGNGGVANVLLQDGLILTFNL